MNWPYYIPVLSSSLLQQLLHGDTLHITAEQHDLRITLAYMNSEGWVKCKNCGGPFDKPYSWKYTLTSAGYEYLAKHMD